MPLILIAYLIFFFGAINLARMAMFMIGSDLYTVKQARERKKYASHTIVPRFAVIIPAHNEKTTVLLAIKSSLAGSYPWEKLQVIVVDDGSTDETPEIISQYIQDHPRYPVTLIRQQNSGKANALNRGIRAAKDAELIMCLDADSALTTTALEHASRYFFDPAVVALSANVKIIPRSGLLNMIQVFEYLICYQMKRAESLFNFEYIIGGIGSTFRRDILEKVGYYDTDTVTEDIDLTMKIVKLGNKKHKIEYGTNVVVYTESVLSIQALIKQRFRWKWGRCQTFWKNRNLFFSTDPAFTRSLTWFYLPFALYGDIAYFFEPLLLMYILFASVRFHDPLPLLSAFVTISFYVMLNIWAEDTLSWRQKIVMCCLAPTMYIFFYILSYVEYSALLKTIVDLPQLTNSLTENNCGWVHVERPSEKTSLAPST